MLGFEDLLLLDIADEKGALADDINEARNANRRLVHTFDGVSGEHVRIGGSDDVEAVPKVGFRILEIHGLDPASYDGTLAERLEIRCLELALERGQAGEHDLHELAAFVLQVRQVAQLFELPIHQSLRFVHQYDNRFARSDLAPQKDVQVLRNRVGGILGLEGDEQGAGDLANQRSFAYRDVRQEHAAQVTCEAS